MDSPTNSVRLRRPEDIDDPLTEVLRAGARRLLAQAVELEAEAFLTAMPDLRLPDGRARLVRHGRGPEREIQTGIGPVPVARVRVRDRGATVAADRVRFTSTILPKWARRTRSLDALPPVLSLRSGAVGTFSGVTATNTFGCATASANAAPAPSSPSANTTLTSAGSGRDLFATGTITITAANGGATWRTGVVKNANALTGVVTLAAPSGATLDGATNGTTTLLPLQRARVRPAQARRGSGARARSGDAAGRGDRHPVRRDGGGLVHRQAARRLYPARRQGRFSERPADHQRHRLRGPDPWVQRYAVAACGAVPTITTVAGLFLAAKPSFATANQIASTACAAITGRPTYAALGSRAGEVVRTTVEVNGWPRRIKSVLRSARNSAASTSRACR